MCSSCLRPGNLEPNGREVTCGLSQKKELWAGWGYEIVCLEPMSEFKFACPVCGQHITADSDASGGQLECPTCFRKIVIPQAPASPDSKFIVSASEVGKPRPTTVINGLAGETQPQQHSRTSVVIIAGVVALVCVAGAVGFVFRDKIFKRGTEVAQGKTNGPPKKVEPKKVYQVPTNIVWSLELTNVTYPDSAPAGSVHGSGFFSEKAVLQGGTLHLRQGRTTPPDLGISIQFFAQLGEDLSQKIIEVTPDRAPPLPKVTLRWKDQQDKAVTKNYNEGYALRVEFGEAANGRMPGKIFISLPDEGKSFAAGTFTAEIRKPPAPKAKQPKKPKTP